MLGPLGRNPAVGIAAAVLILIVGAFALCRSSGPEPLSAGQGQVICVCLKEGTKALCDPPDVGEAPAPCPECGSERAVARVFECHRGHLFIGYLERPPAPESKAAKGKDAYAQHLPLLLRPGLDEEWTPGGSGKGPLCPVCKVGVKRPVTRLQGMDLSKIHMGALPAKGGKE